MSRGFFGSGLFTLLLLVVLFVIGCLFFYWAIEHYVDRNFDSERYSMSKIEIKGNDSFMVWKLDKRTGGIQLCSRTTNPERPLVCFDAASAGEEDITSLYTTQECTALSEKQCTDVVNSVLKQMDGWKN